LHPWAENTDSESREGNAWPSPPGRQGGPWAGAAGGSQRSCSPSRSQDLLLGFVIFCGVFEAPLVESSRN